MSHTPPPWKIEYGNHDESYGGQWFDVGPARVWYPYRSQQERVDQAKADAGLIAAAPDMLIACRAVLASLERLANDGEIIWLDPPHVMSGVHESAIERLKNVIAQAEAKPIE